MQIAQTGSAALYIIQDGCYLCGKRGVDMTEPVDVIEIRVEIRIFAFPVYACKACNDKRKREAQPQPESSTQWVQKSLL